MIRNVFVSWTASFLLLASIETWCSGGNAHDDLPTLFSCAAVSDMLCQPFYRQGNSFLTSINITANIQTAETLIFLSSFNPAHLLCCGSESAWRIPGLHGWLLLFYNHWWAPTLSLTTGMWLGMLTVSLASQKEGIFVKILHKVVRSGHNTGNGCWAFCSSWCSSEQVGWTRWSLGVPSSPACSTILLRSAWLSPLL